eukprot:1615642-Alexandrium_andersonii.AAC.1
MLLHAPVLTTTPGRGHPMQLWPSGPPAPRVGGGGPASRKWGSPRLHACAPGRGAADRPRRPADVR